MPPRPGKHSKWLKATKAKTTNAMKLCKIAEAKGKVKRMRRGLSLCFRAIIDQRKRFEEWAAKKKRTLRNMGPDELLVYKFSHSLPTRTLLQTLSGFLGRRACGFLFGRISLGDSEG